jgi:hypothetical protein
MRYEELPDLCRSSVVTTFGGKARTFRYVQSLRRFPRFLVLSAQPPNIFTVVLLGGNEILGKMGSAYVSIVGETRIAYRYFVWKSDWKLPFERLWINYEEKIKINRRELGCGDGIVSNRELWCWLCWIFGLCSQRIGHLRPLHRSKWIKTKQ